MSINLTPHRFPESQRTAGLVVAALTAIALVILGSVDGFNNGIAASFLLAALSVIGVFVALEAKPFSPKFSELDVATRIRALQLAWHPLPVANMPMWIIAAAFCTWWLAMLGAEKFVGGERVVLLVCAAAIPPGAALLRHRNYVRPFFERVALRRIGVAFVVEHHENWTSRASRRIGKETMGRFRQTDANKQAFSLWLPQADSVTAPDMPPQYTNFASLAVGEFVGVRMGSFLDLMATAKYHAEQEDPEHFESNLLAIGDDPDLVAEREAHYRDIVNIEYKRTLGEGSTAPEGLIELGLTNGTKISFPTLESGPRWQSALENIRDRTRRIKSAG